MASEYLSLRPLEQSVLWRLLAMDEDDLSTANSPLEMPGQHRRGCQHR